ncbi:DUF397 domain-containing protein [Amycolatopsis samaneae]|uniref:DUF397 domain-containing protein n=1 Tax=Amycolatopsis samaneae TaxID=664691 RepID=A0ABW5GEU2_9PSEU
MSPATFLADLDAAVWRKSSRSSNTGSNNACVEVAFLQPVIAVRDSKAPQDGVLLASSSAWANFLGSLGHAAEQRS